MDKVAAMVDMEVANQEISKKARVYIINKVIMVAAAKDSLEAGGVREVVASKGSKVISYVIIVVEQVICRPLVIGGRMI